MADEQLDTMTTAGKTAPAEKPTPCLARQPILNKDEKVLGYELLFRESQEENRFNSDYEGGTRSIIDTLNIMGLVQPSIFASRSCFTAVSELTGE